MKNFNQRKGHWKAHIERYLWREWQRRGLFCWMLWPISWAFGRIAAWRRASFTYGWRRTERLPLPVIVVGNVTLGGTGKTPTVIALVQALRAIGFNPGVVARGYGARIRTHQPLAVMATSNAVEVGDEPLLIMRRTNAPVWVCPHRVAAARALVAAHPEVDVIISDDGLQHYALARDIELVVFDHRLGGNGFLLPAGPLREPITRHRDATLINDDALDYPADNHSLPLSAWPNTFKLQLILRDAWQVGYPHTRRPLKQFIGQRVLAAAGIGAPERFFTALRKSGLNPMTYILPDHFAATTYPFIDIHADAILITEKDAVKWQDHQIQRDARLWAVPVDATLDARLITFVAEKIRGYPPA